MNVRKFWPTCCIQENKDRNWVRGVGGLAVDVADVLHPGEQGSKPASLEAASRGSSGRRAASRRTRIETHQTAAMAANFAADVLHPGEQGSKRSLPKAQAWLS